MKKKAIKKIKNKVELGKALVKKKERKKREPKVVKVIATLEGAVEDAKSEAESLKDELQSWYDNLPEQFQNGEKGSALEEAIDNLDSLESSLSDVDASTVEDMDISTEFVIPNKKASSRAKRLENVMAAVSAIHAKVEDEISGLKTELEELEAGMDVEELQEKITKLEAVESSLSSAIDEASSVEFPGMY